MTRGAKAQERLRVERLYDLARTLGAVFTNTCDWGGCDDPTVAFRRLAGYRNKWLAVCENHARGVSDALIRR